jgi:hypothetical protein
MDSNLKLLSSRTASNRSISFQDTSLAWDGTDRKSHGRSRGSHGEETVGPGVRGDYKCPSKETHVLRRSSVSTLHESGGTYLGRSDVLDPVFTYWESCGGRVERGLDGGVAL